MRRVYISGAEMSNGHVSTCLCFPVESVAMLWLRITYWVTWSSCVFNPHVKYSVPRIIKLLYLGHLLHVWAYTTKLYVFSCWVSECFQVSSAFRQGPSKLIILLDFLIFFQVICNYIEIFTAHSPKIWLYDFKCSIQMSISYN